MVVERVELDQNVLGVVVVGVTPAVVNVRRTQVCTGASFALLFQRLVVSFTPGDVARRFAHAGVLLQVFFFVEVAAHSQVRVVVKSQLRRFVFEDEVVRTPNLQVLIADVPDQHHVLGEVPDVKRIQELWRQENAFLVLERHRPIF